MVTPIKNKSVLVKEKEVKSRLYTVLRDTREQQGWIFQATPYCAGTIIQKLPTGDYTLQGLEKKFTIERKKTVAEFARNIVEKRFERQLVRMDSFDHSFVVCEFTYDDLFKWPYNCGIPREKIPCIKITKEFILRKLMEFETAHKTKFLLVGVHAKEVVQSIFKRIYLGAPQGGEL
jgi:hypothetical protein